MADEIERKFLFQSMPVPDATLIDNTWVTKIRQAYLISRDEGILRIRNADGYTELTAKGPGNLSRKEEEILLTDGFAAILWTLVIGTTIEKTRYGYFDSDNVEHVVDVFDGELAGLILMEIEFPDLASAGRYALPYWASEAVEVTDDPAYKNNNLALKGLPK